MSSFIKRISCAIVMVVILINILGCAAKKYSSTKISNIVSVPGIYHKVKRGQTLWGISKAYNVDLQEIVKVNKIPDASKINSEQLIFIPYAEKSTYDENVKGSVNPESDFIWPVKGKLIVHFGMKYDGVKNKGIRIKAKKGIKVKAARSGEVSFCEDKVKGKGKIIIIDHYDGFVTVYAHNSENLVKVGQKVKQGEIIAKVGSTGRTDTAQLYFEIRKGHIPQNPFYYLP